jgi:DNA-binding IclR family transcriptional regulator
MDDSGSELIRLIAENPGVKLAELIAKSKAPEARVRDLVSDLCRNDILELVPQ